MHFPRSRLGPVALLVCLAGCATLSVELLHNDQKFVAMVDGKPLLSYWLKAPTGTALPVKSGDFFHPLTTPKGIVVTDLAPADHPHHRGLFLGWVEMHGAKDADFWGWGEHAPIKDRVIVNQRLDPHVRGGAVEFDAENAWEAAGTELVHERLHASVRDRDGVRVVDLVYRLTPAENLTLTRWAFGGFCLRVRKEGDIRFYSPDGPIDLPAPNYLKPESDWPDASWYACEQTLTDGTRIGAAIINHPDNPPTLWHNQTGIRMINPCIVAPSALELPAGRTLVLRYRVATFDGEIPIVTLDRLAREWAGHR